MSSHQPFSTEEWVRATINGVVHEITVTGDANDLAAISYLYYAVNAFATALNRLAADPSILGVSDEDGADREKKAALDCQEKTILDAMAKLEKTNPVDDLKRAVVKRGVRESFTESDEKLFTAFVGHAVLWSREKAQFHFTCGLVVEADTHVEKAGRSYTEVPVRKGFDGQKGAFTWR